MAKKKKSKRKSHQPPGSWHDENGYYRSAHEPELPARWWDIPPLRDHRRGFLLRIVADILHRNNENSAFYLMEDDFVGMLAENERLRRENKKLKIKMRKLTK